MHELSLTREIVAIACQAAGDRRIHTVTLEIGRQACIAPDAIEFCFAAVAQGTLAQGARLAIHRSEGDALKVTTLELEEAA
jgi:hydrogenase nickel incorporation protein HypA/HybF